MTLKCNLEYLIQLDEQHLHGGVILSEWTASIVRDADTAFCSGAYLSAILSAQAAMECHLRYEYGDNGNQKSTGFYELIEQSPLQPKLRKQLHEVRRFRNRWVHVKEPQQDESLLARPEYHEKQLEEFAKFTMIQLRKIIYLEQCI
ncbi:hypothetical protein V22_28880 [Calycomorphotria hydatis]|uniref:DUF4145 domain-containing protein n=1 Tax=Calycomorphotria hydatis TaxID=2528027 RepID=A0A517TB83_9PLAN|nr:hypothetical protein V22_28880 [Calycomorphotria hydatis]